MLNLLERWFAVLMLLYLSSGLTGFLAGDSPFNVWRLEDNPLLMAIQTLMYGITLGFVFLHWRKFTSALRASGWVLALVLLALVSTLWSSDPAFSFRRSLVVIATTVFGIYFGSRYQLPRQLRLLGWTFIILAVFSVACAVLLPQYGIDNQLHRGDWHGILGQKNLLGKAAVVGAIVLWSAKGVLPRVLRIAGLSLWAVLMLMSGSRAAPVVLAALLVLAASYGTMRARMTTLVPLVISFLATGAGLVFLAVRNSSYLLASLGREATLTGRTKIWTAVWTAISSHLVLGYGFGGFWAGLHGESARISVMLGFVARHAHNGFLDLWLELGIMGLLLFTAGYLQAVSNGLRLLRMSPDRLATWPLQYLAFMLLYDLAEGPILRQNNLYWVLYVAVVVSTAQSARIGRQSRAACPAGAGIPLEHLEQQRGHLPRRTPERVGNFHPAAGRGAA
jgi:O-antigen ligase